MSYRHILKLRKIITFYKNKGYMERLYGRDKYGSSGQWNRDKIWLHLIKMLSEHEEYINEMCLPFCVIVLNDRQK